MAVNPTIDSTLAKAVINQITFTNDSLEQHYIALQTMNVSTIFVKEIQNAIKDYDRAPAIEEALYLMVKSYDALGMKDLSASSMRVFKETFPLEVKRAL